MRGDAKKVNNIECTHSKIPCHDCTVAYFAKIRAQERDRILEELKPIIYQAPAKDKDKNG